MDSITQEFCILYILQQWLAEKAKRYEFLYYLKMGDLRQIWVDCSLEYIFR